MIKRFIGLILLVLIVGCPPAPIRKTHTLPAPRTEAYFAIARETMVSEQIEERGVTDRAVLDAMRAVPPKITHRSLSFIFSESSNLYLHLHCPNDFVKLFFFSHSFTRYYRKTE